MLDEVQPPPRALPLGAQLRRGQPDRRHEIAKRQLRQHPRVNLVGLARQRRQPFDPLRVGDQHLPPVADQLVVHEPRAVHRLDHPAHRLVIHRDPPRQPVQTVPVTRRAEMLDQLTLPGDQAHVNAFATEIQPNVQHHQLPPFPGRGAGSARPTAYREARSVLRFEYPGRADRNRARLTYVVRRGRVAGGELHPPALTDPGVSLSTHRAPVIQPWAALPPASEQRGLAVVLRRAPRTSSLCADDRVGACTSAWPIARGTRRCV